MANHLHGLLGALADIASGANAPRMSGFGSLGASGRRKKSKGPRARAKYLSNLPAMEAEMAKDDLTMLEMSLKSSREKAYADFFNKYPEALPIEHRKIDSVVAAFLLGKPRSETNGAVVSDGMRLTVFGREVASRTGPFAKNVQVCPGSFGTHKHDRVTANSMLRQLQAGIRVNDRNGQAYLAPSAVGKQGRIHAPACMVVEINNRIVEAAGAALYRPSTAPARSSGMSAEDIAAMNAWAAGRVAERAADRDRLIASKAVDGLGYSRRYYR